MVQSKPDIFMVLMRGSDIYDAKMGEITAYGVYFRSSEGTFIEDPDTLKDLWLSNLIPFQTVRISSTFLIYGHQV